MDYESEDIFILIDSCLKCNRQDLQSGRRPLVIRSDLFQQLNHIFKGEEERASSRGVLTEIQQKQLDTFHSLLQNSITSVVITQRNVDSIENLVLDVNLLKKLKYLHLSRVPLKTLRGLSHLKTQLKTLLIDRCRDLDVVCVAGKLQWAELVELRIRRCGFPRDNVSLFQGMSWLCRLHLNFCEFETCDFLCHLPLLNYLDLSFNRLTRIPGFCEDASKNLKNLILHHNYLVDLEGIQVLTQLKMLDVSWNWLAKKTTLTPLLQLKSLTSFDAANNPISFGDFYRVSVALTLGTTAQEFKLDGKILSSEESCFINSYPKLKVGETSKSLSFPIPSTSGVKRTVSVSKIRPNSSRARQVVIADSFQPSANEGSVLPAHNTDPEISQDVETPPRTVLLPNAENLLNCILLPNSLPENEALCSSTPKLSVVCIEAQVHAIGEARKKEWEDNLESIVNDVQPAVMEDDLAIENFSDPADNDATVYKSCEESRLVDSFPANESTSTYDSSDDSSEPENDEVLWLVQRYNHDKTSHESVFLSLFNSCLVERSTKSNKTLSKWSLSTIETCSKTNVDPVTVEITFNTPKEDKNFRCYVMEFSDSQVLLKNVYEALEEQRVLRCDSCSLVLTVNLDGSSGSCSACSGARTNGQKDSTEKSDESSKPSSIPSSGASDTLAVPCPADASPEGDSGTSSTPTESCSATSSERSSKNDTVTTGVHPKHYESDVEVISSLSQSSVEVLDDESATPERKISQEERKVLLAPPLSTVLEVTSPLSALTESSSSGSLTESVVTTYEPTNNAINKKSNVNECLLEECENSSVINSMALETSEESNGNVLNSETEVYSYTNFIDVDHRIKLFLHQNVFQDDNENLTAFIKCHIWKTGGMDYDGCLAMSNRMLYFFQHAPTDLSATSDASEWLSLLDSYSLDSLKHMHHLPWDLGIEMKINNISFLLLTMDKTRAENVENHLKSLKLRCKMLNSTTKVNALQQVVLQANSSNSQSPRNPDIAFFTLCLSLSIIKDEFSEETMRLAGVIVASSEFFIVPGNLSWLCSDTAPMVSTVKDFSSLIEVEKRKNVLIFHFLDETEAVEETWSIKLPTIEQVERMIESIKGPWESMFSAPLEIKGDSV